MGVLCTKTICPDMEKKIIPASILAMYSCLPLADVKGQNFTSVQAYLTILKHLLNICIHANIIAWPLLALSVPKNT